MGEITVITDRPVAVAGQADRARGTVLVDPTVLADVLGWELTSSGLCRGDRCVPVADPAVLLAGDRLDLVAVAAAVGQAAVVDLDAGLVALALPAELRRRALHDLVAAPFALPDLEGTVHTLEEWRGSKKLLVAFASWCGCRYDLPGWQALHDELAGEGFTVLAVAIDQDPEDVRPFTAGVSLPVLYDRHHLLTELYAISNVPTVVWIDEDDRIVRPNSEAFGTDLFAGFTGAVSGPHLDLVRRWVRTGEVPLDAAEARGAVADLSVDEVAARLHFRVAAEAHRRGDTAATRRHLDRAAALAPDDLTVWRAGMPLVGEDPFGSGFLDRYEAWTARGSPAHRLRTPDDAPAPAQLTASSSTGGTGDARRA